MSLQSALLDQLRREAGVLVTIQSTRGSVPRAAGTWMAVFSHSIVATVGGGHLEFDAIAHARNLLEQGSGDAVVRYALGPVWASAAGARLFCILKELTHPAPMRCVKGWPKPWFP